MTLFQICKDTLYLSGTCFHISIKIKSNTSRGTKSVPLLRMGWTWWMRWRVEWPASWPVMTCPVVDQYTDSAGAHVLVGGGTVKMNVESYTCMWGGHFVYSRYQQYKMLHTLRLYLHVFHFDIRWDCYTQRSRIWRI